MKPPYAIRKVYVGTPGTPTYIGGSASSPTNGELAEELASRILGFFGAVTETDEDREELSAHLIREGMQWVDDKHDVF